MIHQNKRERNKNRKSRELGKWGEDMAASYLTSQGLEMIGRNYFTPYGELDLIAREDECLVFVEVKTRTSLQFGTPLEAVGKQKQEHLRRAAELYMQEYSVEGPVRFDVVGILKRPGQEPEIEYLRYAF